MGLTRNFLATLTLLAAALIAPLSPAVADGGPFLVLDTGVHEAAINAMAPLADGGGIVTVSDDKTARIWRADGSEALGELLPPIGSGDDGALYAVATSAKVIAVAGRIRASQGGFGIAFYSTQDYRSLALISGLPSVVLAMKMSPAGDRLAVGLEGGGLRVFDLKTQTQALEDTNYPGKITSLDFDSSGRLAVASDDSTIQLYDSGLHRLPAMTIRPGARAYGVAFSPDGTRLAAGDRARPVVYLFNMRTMRFDHDLEGAPGKSGSFNVVAFSPDGSSLFGAGSYLDSSGVVQIRHWALVAGAAVDIPVANDLVTSLVPNASGVVFATAEPTLGLVDAANRAHVAQSPRHIDFHDRERTLVRLSRSGAEIEVTQAHGRPLVVDVSMREFSRADVAARDFVPPTTSAYGMTITDWRDNRAPRVNGERLALEPAETARSAAVSPAGAAVGTDFFVRFTGRNGTGWKVSTGSPVWAVQASADGRLVVACLGDGTIHWYNAADGRELIALFIDPATQRFVQWTPAGYFDHDHRDDGKPDGRTLIGYRINETSGRTSDFISIGQLYPTWFRPDLVGLSFRDDNTARHKVVEQERQTPKVVDVLQGGLPPKVTVLDACAVDSAAVTACNGARSIGLANGRASNPPEVTAPVLLVRYKVDDRGGETGSVVPHLNDAVFNCGTTVESMSGHSRIEHTLIPLARGLNVVRLSPVSGNGAIEAGSGASPEIRVVRSVETPPKESTAVAPETNARLFVLTVGVSKLADPDWNLANPANDATALADLLRQDQVHLFAEVIPKTLIDADASKANILEALREIASKVTPDDVVVIFLAGHGRTVDGHYYFASSDMGRRDPALLAGIKDAKTDEAYDKAVDAVFRAEGVSQDDLLPLIQGMQATRIAFMLDTCYSATVADADAVLRHDVNDTITNRIGHASGRFVLSGSFTEAFDSAAGSDAAVGVEGHGLFTSYLLRALNGDAGTDEAGRIDIYKLATFTQKKVEAASRHMLEASGTKAGEKAPDVQQPAYYFAGNDFFAVRKLPSATIAR
jgi:WD40 repeat protein